MKVKELIASLRKMPAEATVYQSIDPECNGYHPVGDVEYDDVFNPDPDADEEEGGIPAVVLLAGYEDDEDETEEGA
ncbi:MAG: hypothetical protein ABL994_23665 [Verrucomicrobiales bacterium]